MAHDYAIAESGWRRWLRRIGVDLRQDEGVPSFFLFACLFLILCFQISTKTIRQSFFVDELGADRLPWVYLLVALLAYPALRFYGRLTGRLPVERLLVLTSLWISGGLIGFWLFWDMGGAGLTVLFYVGSSIVYALLLSQFWMLASHVFDARQARRLFPFVGAGGLLGAMCGGQIARLTSEFYGSRTVLPVAALLLGALVLLIITVGRSRHEWTTPSSGPSLDPEGATRWGFAALRRSRLLMSIASVLVLATIVGQIVDLQFNWAIEQSTVGLDNRTASFGNFFTILGGIAFVFQILMTGRILKVAGVGFALRVLPVFLAVGTLPLVGVAFISPETLLLAALGLKLGESGLRYSLDQSARELLFLPIPARQRRQAKTFIDVVCQRGAKGFAAILLLPVAFQLMEPPQAGWISLFLIALWLLAVLATSREYVSSFRTSLELRTVDTEVPIDLRDAKTLEILLEALGSPDPRPVLHSLEILRRNDRGHLVSPLLLYHDDPLVRIRTLEVLGSVGREDAAQLVERRLGDENPSVRAEAIRTLAHLRGEEARDLMLPRLHEPDAAVRAAAVAFLLSHGTEVDRARAHRVLTDLLADADPETRIEGTKALGGVRDPIGREELLRLIGDLDVGVAREAIHSVGRRVDRDGYCPFYVPTLVARLGDRRIRHDVQAALVAFGAPAVPSLAHFLLDTDESEAVRNALPGVLARTAVPEAADELLLALESEAKAGRTSGRRRRRLIEAMSLAGRKVHGHRYDPMRVFPQVTHEARAYGLDLMRLHGLGGSEKPDLSGPLPIWTDGVAAADLLNRLLAERLDTRLWCLFALLSLTRDSDDLRVAYHGLKLPVGRGRARAFELLSHALAAEVRSDVLVIVDDAPVSHRLGNIGRHFGIARLSRHETLRSFLRPGSIGSEDSQFAAAALYAIHTGRETGFQSEVERLAEGAEAGLVRETAGWLLEHPTA